MLPVKRPYEQNVRVKMLQVLIFALWVCGCSSQKTLAKRLEGADRVVVTNNFDGLSVSITGEEVSKLVQAIAASKKESHHITATPGHRLEFFKGTEHLTTVTTSYQVFWVKQMPYVDTTETLKTLYDRIRDQRPPRLSP